MRLVPEQKISYITLKNKFLLKKGKQNCSYWLCVCVCGKEITRRDYYLKTQVTSNRILSCGCKHPINTARGDKSIKWVGCGKLSGQYFSHIKCKARQRNLVFEIDIKYAWALFEKQDSRCALTDLPINLKYSRRTSDPEQTASLDRIDPNLGYVKDNLQWVHKKINIMKNNFSQERFLEICCAVAQTQE